MSDQEEKKSLSKVDLKELVKRAINHTNLLRAMRTEGTITVAKEFEIEDFTDEITENLVDQLSIHKNLFP